MKLLKKLINKNEETQVKANYQVNRDRETKSSICIILSGHIQNNLNVIRHFAVEMEMTHLHFLNDQSFQKLSSLAVALFGLKEEHHFESKSIVESIDQKQGQAIVMDFNDSKWLEHVLYLRRQFSEIKVYLNTSESDLYKNEKNMSKYRENFSGVILKSGEGLENKIQGVPVIFSSDGIIKLSRDRIAA